MAGGGVFRLPRYAEMRWKSSSGKRNDGMMESGIRERGFLK